MTAPCGLGTRTRRSPLVMWGCFCPGKGPSKPSLRKRRTISRGEAGTSLLTDAGSLRDLDPDAVDCRQVVPHPNSEQNPVFQCLCQGPLAFLFRLSGCPHARALRDLAEDRLRILDRLELGVRERSLKILLDHM